MLLLTACEVTTGEKELKNPKKDKVKKSIRIKKEAPIDSATGKRSFPDAPDFVLQRLPGGEDFSLSEFSGKVLIIDFWATWCGPCKMSIPSTNNLYKKYKSKGLEVIGISLDRSRNQGDLDKLAAFIKEHSMEYVNVLGTPEVQAMYSVDSIPQLFIVNREGKVVKLYKGYSARIEAAIEKTIKELL